MTINSIYIKCPDGFCNQLRLALAANFLVENNFVRDATQEWIVNHHNIVDFSKFFEYLPSINLDKISIDDAITTQSFNFMIKQFKQFDNVCIIDIFQKCFKRLILKSIYQKLITSFINDNKIEDCIGLHLRTGCKTALLQLDKTRHQPIPQQAIIKFLHTNEKRIFLATDNKETQDKFIDLFPDRLIYFEKLGSGFENFKEEYDPKLVSRHTTDIHVVADFYILQYCKYFIGSNESSLSLMVKYIRNNNYDYPVKGIL